MSKKVKQSSLDMIDEILTQEDPDFMKDLGGLDAEVLNAPKEPEPEKKQRKIPSISDLRVFLSDLEDHQRRVLITSGFMVFIALPLVGMALFGVFTPKFSFTDIQSLEMYSDEMIPLDSIKRETNILSLFSFKEHVFSVREHVVNIVPKDGVKFVRVGFSVQVRTQKDLEYLQERQDLILDVFTTELQKVDYTAFSGIVGKNKMKRKLLGLLQTRVSKEIFNLYYKRIIFNQ